MNVERLAENIKSNIQKVIIGKSDVIDIVVTSLIAGGHVLLEDVPGTGKTVLSRALAKSIDCKFKRAQFTPDLMPSDLTGINYFNQKEGEFVLRKGPVFTNILLGDEINRATPRTQSSLLEAMEEKQVTIDGTTYKLAEPFFVIASENPVESQGTFPLPEAQLDRFLVKIKMGYPTIEEGKAMISRFLQDNPLDTLEPVCTKDDIVIAQKECKKVFVSEDVKEYILKIQEKTLKSQNIVLGVSPRGIISMVKAAQVYAAISGRSFVTPDDIKKLCPYVWGHRIIIKNTLKVKGITNNEVMEEILNNIEVPTEQWSKEVI